MSYQRIILLVALFSIVIVVGPAAGQETAQSTGHEYEFVEADGITWEEARDAASERTHNGKQGYLVTITSEEEQEFVASLSEDEKPWIGASDAADEGTWRWVTGPEGTEDGGQGKHFFTQSGEGGTPTNPNYANWNSGEPNDQEGEDYVHLESDGTWNDQDNIGAENIDGYIVEYGGLEDESDGTDSGDSDDSTDSGDSDDSTDSNSGQIDPSISFEPSPPEAGEQVAFSATESAVSNREIISYNWKFGDGDTATGATVSHTYSESGGYNVELTVITDQGNSYSTTEPVSVEEGETETSDGGSISVETPGFGFGSVIISFGGLAYIIRRKFGSP